MKYFTFLFILLVLISSNFADAQETWQCGTVDSLIMEQPQIIGDTIPFVVVFIDFPDGRKQPGNIFPAEDSLLDSVENINAVGNMGYVYPYPGGSLIKKARKYEYHNYWDMFFSVGTYTSDLVLDQHPDYYTHDIKVFGSVIDYYKEATYNNVILQPVQTHPGVNDMYHSGIINHIDSVNGKKYIRWIMWNVEKPGVGPNGWAVNIDTLGSWACRGIIDFDTTRFLANNGRIITVNAGSNAGGQSNVWPYCAVREKRWQNDTTSSTLDGIWVSAHELGHTFGALHTETVYDVMNYSTRNWKRHLYCPPHFNPWTKLQQGWIPIANVRRVRTNKTDLRLPPSTDSAVVAVITIFGDAGRFDRFDHSEYLIVEYKKRKGFNRFVGGEELQPTYTGGGLIWHYSSINIALPGFVASNVKPKIPDAHIEGGWAGSPDDLFPTREFLDTSLSVDSTPNSNSWKNTKTGIYINGFDTSANRLTFNVQYRFNPPPDYQIFYANGSPPQSSLWSGQVYLESSNNIFSGISISPGTNIDIYGGSTQYHNLGFSNVIACGTSEFPITFEGVRYRDEPLERWGGLQLKPISSSPRSIIQHCIFNNYDIAAESFNYAICLDCREVSNGISPIMINNQFLTDSNDIVAQGSIVPGSPALDISGYDSNIFNRFILYGRWKLDSSTVFTIPAGQIINFSIPCLEEDTTRLTLYPNRHVIINGTLKLNSLSQLYFSLNSLVKIQQAGTFNVSGTTLINGSGKICINSMSTLSLNNNAKLNLPQGIQLEFQPNHTITWGTNTSLTVRDTVKILGGSLTVGNTGKLIVYSPAQFLFSNNGSSLTINGKLSAYGTLSQPIVFTSSAGTPAPGDWEGILCSGGGPDTLTYSKIKYASTGITFSSTAANCYMANDTISNTSYLGVFVTGSGTANTALRIYKCGFKHNDDKALKVNNTKVLIGYSRFENNELQQMGSSNIYICNGAKVYMDSTRIQNNIGSGIEISGTNSRVSLSIDETKRGYNTVTENGVGEIRVRNSATAFLGYTASIRYCSCPEQSAVGTRIIESGPGCPPGCSWAYRYEPRGGWNNVFSTNIYNCRLINNETSTTVNARYTYWGGGPSNMFCGSVDSLYRLGSAVNTPSKAIFIPPEREILAADLSKQQMLEWLKQLKIDIEENRENAVDAFYQLALHVGAGGEYQEVLPLPWETYLLSVETSSLPTKLKLIAASLRLQSKLDVGQYDDAINLANQILSSGKINNDLWLYCQTRKIFASIGRGDSSGAWSIFNGIRDKGMSIDSSAILVMQDYLTIASGENNGEIGSNNYFAEKEEKINSSSSKTYRLEPNYPNPFNPITKIRYELPEASHVVLKVYDMLGREVRTLIDGFQEAGFKSVSFDAGDLTSGVYFYRIHAGRFSDIKKMLLIR